MKKIYNSPVATVFNALPVSMMMALSTNDNDGNSLGNGDIGDGNGKFTINSRDNEGSSNSGNVWDEQW